MKFLRPVTLTFVLQAMAIPSVAQDPFDGIINVLLNKVANYGKYTDSHALNDSVVISRTDWLAMPGRFNCFSHTATQSVYSYDYRTYVDEKRDVYEDVPDHSRRFLLSIASQRFPGVIAEHEFWVNRLIQSCRDRSVHFEAEGALTGADPSSNYEAIVDEAVADILANDLNTLFWDFMDADERAHLELVMIRDRIATSGLPSKSDGNGMHCIIGVEGEGREMLVGDKVSARFSVQGSDGGGPVHWSGVLSHGQETAAARMFYDRCASFFKRNGQGTVHVTSAEAGLLPLQPAKFETPIKPGSMLEIAVAIDFVGTQVEYDSWLAARQAEADVRKQKRKSESDSISQVEKAERTVRLNAKRAKNRPINEERLRVYLREKGLPQPMPADSSDRYSYYLVLDEGTGKGIGDGKVITFTERSEFLGSQPAWYNNNTEEWSPYRDDRFGRIKGMGKGAKVLLVYFNDLDEYVQLSTITVLRVKSE